MAPEENDTVCILEGAFAHFSGEVEAVDPQRRTLRIVVAILDRVTPLELKFSQVEKI